MQTLKDKMLKAIKDQPLDPNKSISESFSEACARVAEEEIGKVIDEAAEVVQVKNEPVYYSGVYSHHKNEVDKESILKLKDKYLSGGNQTA